MDPTQTTVTLCRERSRERENAGHRVNTNNHHFLIRAPHYHYIISAEQPHPCPAVNHLQRSHNQQTSIISYHPDPSCQTSPENKGCSQVHSNTHSRCIRMPCNLPHDYSTESSHRLLLLRPMKNSCNSVALSYPINAPSPFEERPYSPPPAGPWLKDKPPKQAVGVSTAFHPVYVELSAAPPDPPSQIDLTVEVGVDSDPEERTKSPSPSVSPQRPKYSASPALDTQARFGPRLYQKNYCTLTQLKNLRGRGRSLSTMARLHAAKWMPMDETFSTVRSQSPETDTISGSTM